MSFKITGDELRKALKDIKAAEKNGFNYCEAVFKPCGVDMDFVKLRYSDMYEKAHPSDGNLDWGRFQGVTRRNKFVNGNLKPLPTK